jgi:hypothetical protein
MANLKRKIMCRYLVSLCRNVNLGLAERGDA